MSKTVVGFFSSTKEAQNAKHELVDAGYSAGDIRVMDNDQVPATAGASSTSESEGGFGATISNFFKSLTGGNEDEPSYQAGVKKGGAVLSVTVADGREHEVAKLVEQYGGRGVEDQTAVAPSAAKTTAASASAPGTAVPIVQEELVVGKQQVQRGGVRVYSHLVETPVEESIRLQEEHVYVNRQAVNRPATEADFTAFKEGTIELTETAEQAVVSKNARVVEELVVGKETTQRTETVKDTVRHTEVEVEQLGSGLDNDFRNHFQTNYAKGGKTYESYAPAYQYGQTLGSDSRYASQDWATVETSAKKDWANQGSGPWEDFKGAVQQGWSKVRTATATKNN